MAIWKFQRAVPKSSPGTPSTHRTVRLDWVLLCAGSLGLVYCIVAGSFMVYARSVANGIIPVSRSGTDGAILPVSFAFGGVGVDEDARPKVVGKVEIPAIGLMTPLLAGDDAMSLSEGAGHIPGTAMPGGLGTVGIAGHRDTHFRLLGKVTPGMDIRVVSLTGVYHYRATSSEIVWPEQVSVLAIRDVPSLVLVTCYPFRFIGHAPKRFIVHATLVSAAPDEVRPASQ